MAGAIPATDWPVDNFVYKSGVWEFAKRTYKYDYYASSIGWDITR